VFSAMSRRLWVGMMTLISGAFTIHLEAPGAPAVCRREAW
jgi:hypothetical protein